MYLGGLAAALLVIKKNALTNVRLARADAVSLFPRYFQANSLDAIRVFFPDPWPKRRHHKRRMLTRDFLSALIDCLRAGGELHILTDWQDYAAQIEQALKSINQAAAKTRPIVRQTRTGALPSSKYGRKARREGRAIIQFHLTKIGRDDRL